MIRQGATAVLLAIGFVATSCTAPTLTVAEYADTMSESTDVFIVESQGLSETFQTTVADQVGVIVENGGPNVEDDAVDVTRNETANYFALLEDATSRYIAAISGLNPPRSVSDEHDDYVAAQVGVGIGIPLAREAVESADSLSDIQGALAGSAFQDAQLRVASACLALEAAVRAEGSGLDLGCARP